MDMLAVGQARMRHNVVDMSPQELGREGERIVARCLEQQGWSIVERNWTCPYGEADIIAYDDGECVFVEVKTRLVKRLKKPPFPEMAVDEAKRRRYVRMAQYYMAATGVEYVRFDVIALQVLPDGLMHLNRDEDAFGCEC